MFRVSGSQRHVWSLEVNDTWELALQAQFSNPLPASAQKPKVETHLFEKAVEWKYVRFDIDSFFGSKGGGLDYFSVITLSGNHCLNV